MMGEVALECIIPTVMAALIDHMYTEDMMVVIKYGAVLIFLAVLSLICGSRSAKSAATASTGFAKNLRRDLFYKVHEFSFGDMLPLGDIGVLNHFPVCRFATDVTEREMPFGSPPQLELQVGPSQEIVDLGIGWYPMKVYQDFHDHKPETMLFWGEGGDSIQSLLDRLWIYSWVKDLIHAFVIRFFGRFVIQSLPLLIAILWLRNSRELSNQNDRSQAMTYVMKSFLKLTGF